MKKYYIDTTPFLYDNLSKWEMILLYIEDFGDYIDVIQEVICSSDKESRIKIKQLLNDDATYFNSCKPIDRTISLSPFLSVNEFVSVCFKYKINARLLNEIRTNWLIELKETLVIDSFIVFSNSLPVLWVNVDGAVVLLTDGGKQAFQNEGFNLEEYNISLNQSLYGIGMINDNLNM